MVWARGASLGGSSSSVHGIPQDTVTPSRDRGLASGDGAELTYTELSLVPLTRDCCFLYRWPSTPEPVGCVRASCRQGAALHGSACNLGRPIRRRPTLSFLSPVLA